MYYTIYKITNLINGKHYIGKHQTKNLDDGYMGSGKLIKRAIAKYGIENFSKEILHVFNTEHDMNSAEKDLVVLSEQSYNLCDGGQGGFGYIIKNGLNIYEGHKDRYAENFANNRAYYESEQFKRDIEKSLKLAEAARKKLYPDGTFSGKSHSDKTKNDMKGHKRQSGEKNSQFGKRWITDGVVSTRIGADEEIPEGWRKGRFCLVV